MSRHANVARMARDEARSRRRVLIVARTSFEAVKVLEAVEDTLRPRDGAATVLRGHGLWSVHSTDGWGRGHIDVRVQGPGVRGMSADTLLADRNLKRASLRESWPVTGGADAALIGVW